MERKRLRVDGIPTNIPVERAKDKLTIHFLRTRNGGGEVDEIEMFSGPPLHAIITFEDDEVVERVLKIKDHVLKIKDKTYNLGVNKVPGKLKLDEVFKKSSLSVNYKILPEKLKNILKDMRATYKDVKFEFDEKSNICEISGSFTKIQTLSQEIIKKIEFGHGSTKEDSSNTHRQAETNQSTLRKHLDFPVVSRVGDNTSLGRYASAEQVSFLGETTHQLQEPFVWDSDIFMYIMKFHSSQYREILNTYNVQAIEESSDEITTIILQSSHENKDCVINLRDAQIRLMELYQGLEQNLRKEQIDKRDWNGDKDIHMMLLKDLKSQFPMLLCHEDDKYIFLIGYSGDVGLGKQYIIDLQLRFNNPPGNLPLHDIQYTGGQLSTAIGERDFMSMPYKHNSYENKEEGRIAALFNSPTDNNSYLKSHLHDKYLSSSSTDPKQSIDLEHSSYINKSPGTIDYTSLAYRNTADNGSFSQDNEKSGSKSLTQIKKMDVLSALNTGRVDIRQNKSTSKSVEKIKPVRISKASSEIPYSSLIDAVPQSLDFKPAQPILRRSSSFSKIYAKDSSDHQDGTSQLKEEIYTEDWLWHYMKEFHKSDIDTWCADVTLTTEKLNESSTVLKLNAFNKTKLRFAMEHILLLYQNKRNDFTKTCIQYSSLGVKGPDDAEIKEWCSVFRSCSNNLCIKLEKDALLLIYPKVARKKVLEKYACILKNKDKYPDTLSLVKAAPSCLVTIMQEKGNHPDYSHQNETQYNVKYLERKYFQGPEDFTKHTEVQKTSHVGGKNKSCGEDEATVSSFFPALQNENIQKPLQLQEAQDFPNSDIFLKDPDRLKSRHSDLDNYQTNVSEPSLAKKKDSASDLSELRRPAVGQESDRIDKVCDSCKRDDKASTLACGHYVCDNCHSAFKGSCFVCPGQVSHGKRKALNATMTYSSLALSLSGYDRNTCIKIKYEVPDGIQRAEDPHPGKPYKGGTFLAYIPENNEGKKLLSLLEKSLNQDLTFKITSTEHGDVVTWHKIPHKTSLFGGISKKGYPDSQYIKNMITLMEDLGIE
ncbi:uncharacterized protein ACMZJ9_018009 [Mantella aurantiaca]